VDNKGETLAWAMWWKLYPNDETVASVLVAARNVLQSWLDQGATPALNVLIELAFWSADIAVTGSPDYDP
jgi:hypothetical protein